MLRRVPKLAGTLYASVVPIAAVGSWLTQIRVMSSGKWLVEYWANLQWLLAVEDRISALLTLKLEQSQRSQWSHCYTLYPLTCRPKRSSRYSESCELLSNATLSPFSLTFSIFSPGTYMLLQFQHDGVGLPESSEPTDGSFAFCWYWFKDYVIVNGPK